MLEITKRLTARRDAIMNGTKKDEGFTLIELLIVVLIIGVLAAIAIPVYLSTVDNTKKTAGQQTVSQLVTSITAWSAANNGTFPARTNFSGTTGADADLAKSVPTDDNLQVSYGAGGGHYCVVATYINTANSTWVSYDGTAPSQSGVPSAAASSAVTSGVTACPGITLQGL